MVFSQKLVVRYSELKSEVPDCLLLMQVGVFMQIMNEDVRVAAGVTGMKLQMCPSLRAKRGNLAVKPFFGMLSSDRKDEIASRSLS